MAYYNAAIDRGELPLARGLALSGDDLVRAAVIEELICHFRLDFAAVENRFGIRFADYFVPELGELQGMERDGLLVLESGAIRVTPVGRMLIRRICMVFDAWLRAAVKTQNFSKII